MAGGRLIGPLPGIGSSRIGWDRTGRFVVTLAADDRLLGLSADEEVWEKAATGTRDVAWRVDDPLLAVIGDGLLVDSTGTARVPGEADVLRLSPDGTQLLVRSRRERRAAVVDHDGRERWRGEAEDGAWVGDRVAVVYDGTVTVVDPASGSAWQLDDEGYDAVEAGADGLAVGWGPHTPFTIFDAAGELRRTFPNHERDPNTAAAVGPGVVATTGGDGRVVVHDLLGHARMATIELDDAPHRLSFDPSGRWLMVEGVERRLWSRDDRELRPLTRPATRAGWSPAGLALGCCDGDDLWIELLR